MNKSPFKYYISIFGCNAYFAYLGGGGWVQNLAKPVYMVLACIPLFGVSGGTQVFAKQLNRHIFGFPTKKIDYFVISIYKIFADQLSYIVGKLELQ